MVKKKVLVFGLAFALLAGSGSVYASALPVDEGSVETVVVAEAGVPAKIQCDFLLVVPFGDTLTGDMLKNHFTVVDGDGNDLGMKDQLTFTDNKGARITADEKAADFNAGLSRGEPTVGLDGFYGVYAQYGVKFLKEGEVGVPVAVIGNPAFEIPADVDITGDLLRSHFTIVDEKGNDLGMKDKIRFMTGKGASIMPEEQATLLIAAFRENIRAVVPVLVLVDGYPGLICDASVLLGEITNVPFDIAYATHVQNEGWQKEVKDGKMSGTEGKSLRLEGLTVESGIAGVGIEYKTHVENIGWQDYVADGKMSGTSGKGLRLEAVQIRLTGENADLYDVYYRVHTQNIGWMGWASNDAPSGSAGFGYRLEGIEIKIVDKGAVVDVGGEAFKDANTVQHTVTFHSPYINAVVRPKVVNDGQLVTPFTMGWKDGTFTFKYWTTDIVAMTEFDFSQPVKQSCNLYPVFADSNGQLVCPRIDSAKS